MINEWEEFCAYTGTVSYTASKKSDTTWLGRFTFATILEFEGMARILTVLARGYLFHSKDGAVISGDPHDRIDYARHALCAWCSVPEDGKRVQDKEWQFQTDFSELHTEFPELVDGWMGRTAVLRHRRIHPVSRSKILTQVIAADGGKIHLLCQLVRHHHRRRGFYHNAKLNMITHCHTALPQALFFFQYNYTRFCKVFKARDHGEHQP